MASEKGTEVARNYAEASDANRRKVVAGHFHEEVSPTHFCKVLLAPVLDLLPIPSAFREHLGQIPKEIILKTKTGCNWRVSVVDFNGYAAIDNGWPAFAMCHNLKIGNFLTFKVLRDDEFRITVFDTEGVAVIRKCEKHPQNILLICAATPPVA